MRSILNKVNRFLRNLSNASHIRNAYNKAHTVKNRLKSVNIGIGICVGILVAVLLAILVSPDTFVEAETETGIACTAITGIAIWLLGYRRAIAIGQTNRQAYITNSRRAYRRLCRGLGRLFLVLLVLVVIIIALMVVAQKYGFLTDVFPSLKGIADCILARLNEMLSNLLAKMS